MVLFTTAIEQKTERLFLTEYVNKYRISLVIRKKELKKVILCSLATGGLPINKITNNFDTHIVSKFRNFSNRILYHCRVTGSFVPSGTVLIPN